MGFHTSRNESPSRGTRSPNLVLRDFNNLRLISFAALSQFDWPLPPGSAHKAKHTWALMSYTFIAQRCTGRIWWKSCVATYTNCLQWRGKAFLDNNSQHEQNYKGHAPTLCYYQDKYYCTCNSTTYSLWLLLNQDLEIKKQSATDITHGMKGNWEWFCVS